MIANPAYYYSYPPLLWKYEIINHLKSQIMIIVSIFRNIVPFFSATSIRQTLLTKVSRTLRTHKNQKRLLRVLPGYPAEHHFLLPHLLTCGATNNNEEAKIK